MTWVKDNIKTALSIWGVVCGIIGFLIGVYVMQRTVIEDIKHNYELIYDLKNDDVYWIKQWIANPENYR